MPKGYNSLNYIKINVFEIGICPVCSRRLTAECEHQTDESEAWYAAQILAEQELYNDAQPETPDWQIEAEAREADAEDLRRTQEDARF